MDKKSSTILFYIESLVFVHVVSLIMSYLMKFKRIVQNFVLYDPCLMKNHNYMKSYISNTDVLVTQCKLKFHMNRNFQNMYGFYILWFHVLELINILKSSNVTYVDIVLIVGSRLQFLQRIDTVSVIYINKLLLGRCMGQVLRSFGDQNFVHKISSGRLATG